MRTTTRDLQRMKDKGEKIPMVTAYDYTSAQMVERSGIPVLLVGDTLGMVVLGYDSTVPVTMDDMLHHTRAVARGNRSSLLVGDLPFLTYTSPAQALENAGRMLQTGGVQAVKLEGGASVVPVVQTLVEHGIPVMGHLGLTPQSVNQIGGMRVQGRRADAARRLLDDAAALQEAGAFAVVLELVPAELAGAISSRLRVPTIGIGAGPQCDGQVLVWHDLLGLFSDFVPKHTRRYATLAETISDSLQRYATDVRDQTFPAAEHGSTMDRAELATALEDIE